MMVKVLTAARMLDADAKRTPWAEIEYVSPTPVSMPGLVKVAALEGGAAGLTANAVAPGGMLTPLIEGQLDDHVRQHGALAAGVAVELDALFELLGIGCHLGRILPRIEASQLFHKTLRDPPGMAKIIIMKVFSSELSDR